jgi:hypothetical protein
MMLFFKKVAAYDEIFLQKYHKDDYYEMFFRRNADKNDESEGIADLRKSLSARKRKRINAIGIYISLLQSGCHFSVARYQSPLCLKLVRKNSSNA